MVRKVRKSRRAKPLDVDADTVRWLLHGARLLAIHRQPEELPGIWATAGTYLTGEWVERLPGSRPWAWWQFSATVARQAREREPEYLDRVSGWQRGERAAWTILEARIRAERDPICAWSRLESAAIGEIAALFPEVEL